MSDYVSHPSREVVITEKEPEQVYEDDGPGTPVREEWVWYRESGDGLVPGHPPGLPSDLFDAVLGGQQDGPTGE